MRLQPVRLALVGWFLTAACASETFSTVPTTIAAGDGGTLADGAIHDAAFDADRDAAEDTAAFRTTGLELWLRTDNLTDPVVTAWPDISGKARHAAASQPCTTPTLHTGTGGRPAVTFDGSACLILASGVANFESGVTLFVVAETHAQTISSIAPFVRMAGTGSTLAMQFGRDPNGAVKYSTSDAAGNLDSFTGPPMLDGSWSLYEMVQAAGGEGEPATVTIFRDGVALGNGAVKVPVDIARTFNTVGGRPNAPSMAADIGEIALYSRALTETQRRLVEAALKRKWNLP